MPRRGGRIVAVACGVALGLAGSLGWRAVTQRADVVAVAPPVAPAVDRAHGRHLVDHVLACGTCHGSDLGGAARDAGVPVGPLWAPNLTSGHGGVGAVYTPADWERAVRHGVGRGGRDLRFMPARRWATLSEADLADVVAWLRALPPVDRDPEPGARSPGPSLVVARGDGVDVAPSGSADERPAEARWAPDAAYGRYLADVAGCHDCHGADLRGGRTPWSDVAAPDVSPDGLRGWTGADFADAVVRGVGRDGRALDASMPSSAYAGMHDTELDALWAYVRRADTSAVADGTED